jgi:hypothetical protein
VKRRKCCKTAVFDFTIDGKIIVYKKMRKNAEVYLQVTISNQKTSTVDVVSSS